MELKVKYDKDGEIFVYGGRSKKYVHCLEWLNMAANEIDDPDNGLDMVESLLHTCGCQAAKYLPYILLTGAIIFGNKEKLKNGNKVSCSTMNTYLMVDSNTGYTKIGKAKDPRKREKTLQSEKPTISLIKVCDIMIEGELHKKYADKRVRGEWFNLSEQDIADIVKEYNFYDVD